MTQTKKNKKIKHKSFCTRFILYPIEGIFMYIFYGITRIIPVELSSAIFGKLFRTIGPYISKTKIARKNLAASFPDKSSEEIECIITNTWENLGRITGEFSHTPYLVKHIDKYFEFEGLEHIEAVKKSGKPALFASSHLGNWEVASFAIVKCGMALHTFYREANNPIVNKLYLFARRKSNASLIPKGSLGAKTALRHLKNNEYIGIMADQKLNNGIPVEFFGRTAMTASAVAELSLRFDCPIIPLRIERLQGCKFKATAYPPVEKPTDENLKKKEKIAIMIRNINIILEKWISERPEQWLWMHNRWPK